MSRKIFLALLVTLAVVGCTQYAGQDGSARPSVERQSVELEDGAVYSITASEVIKNINGKEHQMYAYNGMIPGPLLKVAQGSRISIEFKNDLRHETTVHWHGLRHNVKDDGVPDMSQEPVKRGGKYTYNLYFPDAGIYWYHPHVREDEQQDLGLAGNILVAPKEPIYNQVNREEVLMLDDIYIDNKGIVPYGKDGSNFALMGRYGNVMLLNGKTNYSLEVSRGDVVRFYLTDASNARPFNISIPGARMKLIGSDIGVYEKEEYSDSVVIAPGERYTIEAYFENVGEYKIMNVNPEKEYELGKIIVSDKETANDYSAYFTSLKDNAEITDFKQYFDKEADYNLRLSIDSSMMMAGRMGMEGMPCHRMSDGTMMGNCGDSQDTEPIEWEDTMRMMNSQATSDNTKWIIHDEETGKENMDITMMASIGDKVKISIFNDPESMHPMQHPIHLHGQRFLVLTVDGKHVVNQVWKDTVLVPIGSKIDILVDATNPGQWMFHCHISEHLEAGMMSKFIVNG